MRTTTRRTTLVTATALVAASAVAPATASADDHPGRSQREGLTAVGLGGEGTSLVRFTTDRPGHATRGRHVDGLDGDQRLVGIDRRVQDGGLYGVGDRGGIYLLDARSADATKVGALSVALEGSSFGVDFNPAANALRVTSDAGQNLRQPFGTDDAPAGATVADAPLTNPATPPATERTPATGITGSAYTNNDLSADTATVLYDLDTASDQLDIQSPANAGLLAATGKLRVDAAPDAGFDIHSTLRDGRTVAVEGFAVLDTGKGYRSYAVNLATGEATDLGAFKRPVTDLAVDLDQH